MVAEYVTHRLSLSHKIASTQRTGVMTILKKHHTEMECIASIIPVYLMLQFARERKLIYNSDDRLNSFHLLLLGFGLGVTSITSMIVFIMARNSTGRVNHNGRNKEYILIFIDLRGRQNIIFNLLFSHISESCDS